MKTKTLIILLSLFSFVVNAKGNDLQYSTDSIYSVVDEMPEFKGGIVALNKFFAQRLAYPKALETYGVKAKIYVRFVIDEKGHVLHAKVVRSTNEPCQVAPDKLSQEIIPIFEQEALQFIQALPPWNAGRKSGQLVKVWTTIPVVFTPPN